MNPFNGREVKEKARRYMRAGQGVSGSDFFHSVTHKFQVLDWLLVGLIVMVALSIIAYIAALVL